MSDLYNHPEKGSRDSPYQNDQLDQRGQHHHGNFGTDRTTNTIASFQTHGTALDTISRSDSYPESQSEYAYRHGKPIEPDVTRNNFESSTLPVNTHTQYSGSPAQVEPQKRKCKVVMPLDGSLCNSDCQPGTSICILHSNAMLHPPTNMAGTNHSPSYLAASITFPPLPSMFNKAHQSSYPRTPSSRSQHMIQPANNTQTTQYTTGNQSFQNPAPPSGSFEAYRRDVMSMDHMLLPSPVAPTSSGSTPSASVKKHRRTEFPTSEQTSADPPQKKRMLERNPASSTSNFTTPGSSQRFTIKCISPASTPSRIR
ncbi:hypothetical protein SBOR_9766 [Sclerotinia borealis F-4128]|uniref:Uncharacterized protein n=1 Tax=Sclerotinia borealis (strain F-4128) TaxID=1432307 RepID=W9C2D8_SCLBF|nr:hypothetical protein SBOR_9766 [Sclerotinia borealis F-4128]